MSRIGKKQIIIPENVNVKLDGDKLIVSSNSNSQTIEIHPKIIVKIAENVINVERKSDDKLSRSLHGLIRSLINNAIIGVTQGFQKDLEIIGVGYRASVEGDKLTLKVGFSHDVEFKAPEGINFEVKKNIVSVKGYDKRAVGQIAAEIRAVKKPEPYKGKGIKYVGEKIIRKVGKAVKATTPGS